MKFPIKYENLKKFIFIIYIFSCLSFVYEKFNGRDISKKLTMTELIKSEEAFREITYQPKFRKSIKAKKEQGLLTPGSRNKEMLAIEKISEYYRRSSWWDEILCQNQKGNFSGTYNLSDILPLKVLYRDVRPHESHSRNIYMIENNCRTSLSFYVLCGIESAARQNPNATVFLLTVTPFLEDRSQIIRKILNHFSNIEILHADYDNLLKSTPIDSFRSTEIWTKVSAFINAHVSDAVRIALLWKSGGTYLDSDIITVKKIPIQDNIILYGSENMLANGFIKIKKHHKYLSLLLNHMKKNYSPNFFISLGPDASTEAFFLYCNETPKESGVCGDISALPPESYLPIRWSERELLFAQNTILNVTELLKNSNGVHTSHHMSGSRLNDLGRNNIYNILSKEFCPFVYEEY